MSVKLENLEDNVVQLEIEVSPQDFEEGMQKSYIKNVKSINIPGFRAGKTPRKIIEQYYGKEIFYEDAINFIVPGAYDKAVKETSIQPVDKPDISVTQLEDDKNFIFTAKVYVKPTFELSNYKGIEIEKKVHNVTDAEIDEEISKLLDRNARLLTLEEGTIENGDTAVIYFCGYVDGEPFDGGEADNYELVIGSGSFIDGFEEQLIGKNSGSNVKVNVRFPDDYHSEELEGREAEFDVVIKEIKRKEFPVLDDEFAKDVSEFDTLDELKADLRKNLEEVANTKSKSELENGIVQKVIDSTEISIPQCMIDSKIDEFVEDYERSLSSRGISLDSYYAYTESSEDDLRMSLKDRAVYEIKAELILEKVAEIENLSVSSEEIENELVRISEYTGTDLKTVKKLISIETVELDLLRQRAFSYLIDNANIKEGVN